jgi:hypothetical protein
MSTSSTSINSGAPSKDFAEIRMAMETSIGPAVVIAVGLIIAAAQHLIGTAEAMLLSGMAALMTFFGLATFLLWKYPQEGLSVSKGQRIAFASSLLVFVAAVLLILGGAVLWAFR